MHRATTRLLAAGIGLLAAAAGIAASSGVAAVLDGAKPVIVAVGDRIIALTPAWLKDFAVATFGEHDKTVLIGGILLVAAAAAAFAGVVGLRHPRVAVGVTTVFGLVALAVAVVDQTSSGSPFVRTLPAVAALVVSVAAISILLSRFAARTEGGTRPRARLASHPGDDLPHGFDRRRFLAAAFGAGLVILAGGAFAKLFGTPAAAASRAAVRLRPPTDPGPPIPAGVHPDVAGVSPYITPNRDFYRVDTALLVPDVPADEWHLRVHGMVDRELDLDFADLLDQRLVERRVTLTCVSNPVGGPYVGNATWIGVPMADLLGQAGVQDGADALKSTSADEMVIGTPIETVTDGRDAMVAVAMNGEPLPLEHGFPARMVVPGLYGYVSATKWLVDLEVTKFSALEAYWTQRGWAEKGPIKLASRIDVPRSSQELPADSVRAGGVAWAQTTGIAKVEVRVDDGDWTQADLATEDTLDTWRQWSWTWDGANPGEHTLTVRATDKDGQTQTSERVAPAPDGSTGWHSVQFSVA